MSEQFVPLLVVGHVHFFTPAPLWHLKYKYNMLAIWHFPSQRATFSFYYLSIRASCQCPFLIVFNLQVTSEQYCRAQQEAHHDSHTYLCLLASTRNHQLLHNIYHSKGERDPEEVAGLVGLRLPKQPGGKGWEKWSHGRVWCCRKIGTFLTNSPVCGWWICSRAALLLVFACCSFCLFVFGGLLLFSFWCWSSKWENVVVSSVRHVCVCYLSGRMLVGAAFRHPQAYVFHCFL